MSYCIFIGLFVRFSGSHVWQCRLLQNTPKKEEGYQSLKSTFCQHHAKGKELGGTALRVARLRESGIVHRRKGQRVGGTAVSAAGIFAFDALMQRNCANQCP